MFVVYWVCLLLCEGVGFMRKLISFMLTVSILLISIGNVFAATVPGAVYTDHTSQEMDVILANAGVKDVKPADWFAKGIVALIQAGFIAPDSSGNINPLAPVTAGDAAAIVAKAVGIANKTDTMEVALQKAKDAGIIGSDVTSLTNMRRIDAATLIAKAFNLSYISIYNKRLFPFEDFMAFTPNERGMAKALNDRGFFLGYAIGDGKYEFRPNNMITKSELATVVARMLSIG